MVDYREPLMSKRAVLVAVLVLVPAIGALWWSFSGDARSRHVGFALAVVALFIAAVLVFFELLGSTAANPERRKFGYLQIVLGADGRTSTSKSVIALWTLLFASSLMLLSAMVWWSGASAKDSFGGNWNAYFLLLGGPFAAGVLANGITVAGLNRSADKKSSTAAASATAISTTHKTTGSAKASDVVTNDSGETDLVDSQYVIFSLVAVAYFVGALIQHVVSYANTASQTGIKLPDIPSALLGLTSLAALTYVGNKTVQTSGLRTVEMKPNPVPAGQPVTVTMVNLPTSSTTTNTYVQLVDKGGMMSSLAPTEVTHDVPTKLTFAAPATSGDYQVTVIGPDTVVGPLNLTVNEVTT
jgi:hypothetical protein